MASAAAFGWLGWEMLRRDDVVEAQRRQERLGNWLSRPSGPVPETSGGLLVTLASSSAVGDRALPLSASIATSGPPLLFYPYVPPSPEARPELFAEGELAEFQARDLRKAAAIFGRLAQTGDAPVRARGDVSKGACRVAITSASDCGLVLADVEAVGLALHNLIDNAVKYAGADACVDVSWECQMAAIVPNGDRKTSTLVLGPTAAGEQVKRVALPRAFGPIPSWLPDGTAVLAWEMSDDGRGRLGHRGGDPLWIVPIDGSAPRRLDVDTRTWVGGDGIRLHPNGTHISYYIGENTREVWALERVAQR